LNSVLGNSCRIIVDPEPQSGITNMAIDAALLAAADAYPAGPVVRIYRWAEPTVTVGYFQKHPPEDSAARLKCPHVKRLTGGGAILHHHEITYSCVVPRTHAMRESPLGLYDVMHSAIEDALRLCGVDVGSRAKYVSGDMVGTREGEPFLCFLRSDPRDLVAVNCRRGATPHPKLVGSAQRRRRGTILQHGSILLRASPLLPDVFGVGDLFADFDERQLNGILPGHLAKSLADSANVSDYTDHERRLAFKHSQQLAMVGSGKPG